MEAENREISDILILPELYRMDPYLRIWLDRLLDSYAARGSVQPAQMELRAATRMNLVRLIEKGCIIITGSPSGDFLGIRAKPDVGDQTAY